MKLDTKIQGATPGTLLSVSVQVKQEAARWRDAASANHWEVLNTSTRLEPRAGGNRHITAASWRCN
ncbi:hypothetical protein [Thiocystis minor]|uniref:hypothetical protein n=1 Tax=Thiocystis minor TaxID=61597 RepID=UPI0019138363|nr:hypothetical protein [Thiocystis minor]